ncbi:MAG TPA: hypothetical protein VLE23_14655 [Geminicoccaceae bacterium]|nr:hypothetical protein [Geminicoccaceae bacterium]
MSIQSKGLMATALAAIVAGSHGVRSEEARVIDLTQTGCQFLESENGVDRSFEPKSADDCNRINAETGDARLAEAKVLELAPGRYTFKVTNSDVPYELGFWIREADYQLGNPLHKLTKTSVSGGGLTMGKTNEYTVELAPGDYLYSCPLNPTPDYRIEVKS